ncbi:Mis6 domain protein [Aspergillus heteromorphus CBS 117.55]|uniref:Mis6 domain protein n=1 Tax=Aspergillus heteromorphus CBS 117.55 TaxID=1448321 RepID=A0A317VK95_9EURO|nr:Mis6 domain protein [Aspergillus heteromorphus CBS 117.55]PWY72340.1 Mis6 domain protein [Aspergillus heteromorphus CBS 117.55]
MSSESDSGREIEVRPDSLQDAVEHFEAVAFVPAKHRYTDAGQLAKTIATRAYESGIPQAALERLLKVLTTSNALDQGTTTTLVKNLYPLESISSKLITQVVCCLGPAKTKPSPATQALLVRWLILVYDFIEDKSHLSKLYAVLFNYLDMMSLRKPLCHLLSFITRRKHVKPFRIQALMELVSASGGEEKELLILLNVFKNYCPDVIVGDLGLSGRKGSFFKHPDPEWTGHVRDIQDTHLERLQAAQPTFQVVHRGTSKRSKMESIVPDVQTSRVSYSHTSLEELRGIEHFVEKIDKIELPNQIISMLGNNLAQKYLFLVHPEAANHRLNDWLKAFLGDQLEYARTSEVEEADALGYILTLAVEYVQYTKEIPGAFVSFLKQYLHSWNGRDNKEQILGLLEYMPIEDFDSIHRDVLLPVESAMLGRAFSSRTALLDFYASLIRQWGIRLRASSSHSEESVPLGRLITHAELLASSALECLTTAQPSADDGSDSEKPATLSILDFYCTLAELFSHASMNASIRITVPLAPAVYTLVFTPISSVISIMSSVLASYKSSFESSLTSPVLQVPNPPDSLYPTDLVGQFNGYIMDVCNLVWRNRGLNSEDPNALGCLIPAATVSALTRFIRESNEYARKRDTAFSFTVSSIFSLSHHVALCNMSAACFSDIEDENNIGENQPKLKRPVTQKALSALEKEGGTKVTWQEYRVRMLDWLDATGSVGIGSLMRSTMKALRKD